MYSHSGYLREAHQVRLEDGELPAGPRPGPQRQRVRHSALHLRAGLALQPGRRLPAVLTGEQRGYQGRGCTGVRLCTTGRLLLRCILPLVCVQIRLFYTLALHRVAVKSVFSRVSD